MSFSLPLFASLFAMQCGPTYDTYDSKGDDTGCQETTHWEIEDSVPEEGQRGVPTDAAVFLHMRSRAPCAGSTWILRDLDSDLEVARGPLEVDQDLNLYPADVPTLEPGTHYQVWVPEGRGDTTLGFHTGQEATTQRGLVPELSEVELVLREYTVGTMVDASGTVTAVASDEVPRPIVQFGCPTQEDGTDRAAIVGEDGTAHMGPNWEPIDDDSYCVAARQLEADGAWGPWSETTCLEPRREGFLRCSTGPAPWGLVPLLWLPWVVRRRRREPGS